MNKELTKEEWEMTKYFRKIKKYLKIIKLSPKQKKELWGEWENGRLK